MKISHINIYCLPNIRSPWVVVYEPHPWGHGALRVKESSAVLVYTRMPSRFEEAWLADSNCHMCRTFDTPGQVLNYEDGQHEHAADVADAMRRLKPEIDAVIARVARKRAEKRAKERKRKTGRVPLNVIPSSEHQHEQPHG